ncbi:MAG: [FeFe] hydrogenase H-cluster radical SAM maturase HydE [Chitinispirillales bacterium]|jgi:biotin synthase|nr:[FeFe] hydrogenase H-cluster radical SAM maturase HydE [Chitinispirillales bacterium]
MTTRALIDKLESTQTLSREEFKELLYCDDDRLFERARSAADSVYGKNIYMRGLIEFTSYCKNDCLYCGLRTGNKKALRYRLSKHEILDCCEKGYALGFRTFVLQGGEDTYYNDDIMTEIVREIRATYTDCAITLSTGERGAESYARLRNAGADRYLLRHETANDGHYRSLHPENMSPANRKNCLYELKRLGYQTGCGFMVGSPGQTPDNIVDDLLFIKDLKPQMVGIGPFIPHSDTPFNGEKPGDLRLTLNLLAILRLMQPNLLIPATTALGTIDPTGREQGILAGANVVMPNLSPIEVRDKYLLYDNKICTGDEAAECVNCMRMRIKSIGYELVVSRGDFKNAVAPCPYPTKQAPPRQAASQHR